MSVSFLSLFKSKAMGLLRAPLVDASTAPDAASAPIISRLFLDHCILPLPKNISAIIG